MYTTMQRVRRSVLPPPNEYTAILGGGSGGGGDDHAVAQSIEVVRRGGMVVGLAEDMTASVVLIARELGWPSESMLYRSMKSGSKNATDPRWNPNRGQYHRVSHEAADAIKTMVRDDLAVYSAAREVHQQQRRSWGSGFDLELERFSRRQQTLQAGTGTQAAARCQPHPAI